jgi:hypothetical protein
MKDASRPRVGAGHFVRSLLATALTATVAMLGVAATSNSATAAAAPPVNLGGARTFAALAGVTVTNVGNTVIKGDLGLSPGILVTGFPPGTVNGTVHVDADPVAVQAQNGLAAAYTDVTTRPLTSTISPALAGQTLTPGVYDTAALGVFSLTGGALTLNAQGDPNAIFIIRGTGLATTSTGTIALTNGAQACNVFFAMSTAAVSLGAGSTFNGNLLVQPTIAGAAALLAGVTVNGRVLVGRLGTLVLAADTITLPAACAAPPPPPAGRKTTTTLNSSCTHTGTQGPLKLTATVRTSGAATATGQVVFTADGVSLGTALLDAHGVATLTPNPALTEGVHQITASFPGMPQLDPSISPPYTLQVGPKGTCPPQKDKDECDEEENKGEKGEKGEKFTKDFDREKNRFDRKHRKDRMHHYDKHGRLVTIQTLHTLHGMFHEGGHHGHHSNHGSWSEHHPVHHHNVYYKAHKKPHYKPHRHYQHYYPTPRPRVAVTG